MSFQNYGLIVEMKCQKIIASCCKQEPSKLSSFQRMLYCLMFLALRPDRRQNTKEPFKSPSWWWLNVTLSIAVATLCCWFSLGLNEDGNLIITRSPPRELSASVVTVAGREGAAKMQDGEQLAISEASNRSNRVTNSSDITLPLFF